MKTKIAEKKLPIPELANLSLPFRKETSYPASLEELLLILENMITRIYLLLQSVEILLI